MRAPRTILCRGFLHGALLYGSGLALVHVAYNRLTSPLDGIIVLVAFVALYGAVSAAAFGLAGVAVAIAHFRTAHARR